MFVILAYRVPIPNDVLAPLIPKINRQFELGKKNYRGYENIKTLVRNASSKHYSSMQERVSTLRRL